MAQNKGRGGKRNSNSNSFFGKKKFESSKRNINNAKESQISDNKPKSDSDEMRLNRYIAKAGICSRREADTYIEEGRVKVNGNVVTELGTKVKPTDSVKVGNKLIKPQDFEYILLNKQKGFITTTDDPEERRTVMDQIEKATDKRVYPVGRLDRNTTGLILFTNDGDLADKLMHPRNMVKKVYEVGLDASISMKDFENIKAGIKLEDGFIKPDDVAIVSEDKKIIGIEIHSGKNRIVRRIFENFGYRVDRLDRVIYAGLTKKDLPRGNYRMLSKEEVNYLKML